MVYRFNAFNGYQKIDDRLIKNKYVLCGNCCQNIKKHGWYTIWHGPVIIEITVWLSNGAYTTIHNYTMLVILCNIKAMDMFITVWDIVQFSLKMSPNSYMMLGLRRMVSVTRCVILKSYSLHPLARHASYHSRVRGQVPSINDME